MPSVQTSLVGRFERALVPLAACVKAALEDFKEQDEVDSSNSADSGMKTKENFKDEELLNGIPVYIKNEPNGPVL